MSACHSVSGLLGTWITRPTSSLLPSGGPGIASLLFRRASPVQSAVCGVGHVTVRRYRLMTRWVVIPLVQAQVLRRSLSGSGALHNYRIKSGSQQLGVIAVCSIYHHR